MCFLFHQELADIIRNESKQGTRKNSATSKIDKEEETKACEYLTGDTVLFITPVPGLNRLTKKT